MKFSKYNLIFKYEDLNEYVLFNTLSGESFVISSEIKNKIRNNDLHGWDKDVFDVFRKHNIIIDDEFDETRCYEYYLQKSKFSGDTITSTVLLTWACNLKCIYCFEGAGAKTKFMDEENANQYIRFMKKQAIEKNARNMHIVLFGGEPLLNIKIGFKILEELKIFCDEKKMNFSCSMITNGTLLTDEIAGKLEYYNCEMIQITLDGTRSAHDLRRCYKNGRGSFDEIMNGLHLLKNYSKINKVIRINIDQNNLDEAYKLLEFIGKEGENFTYCGVDFGIVRGSTEACSAYSGHCISDEEIGNILEDLWKAAENQGFRMYLKPMRKWVFCGLYCDGQYTVTPNCEVYKCWEHTGIEEHIMGKIDKDGSLINTTYAFYEWMSKNPLECKECKECVYLPACGGGCLVVSYNETNTYHSKGCFKVKGILEKQIQRYAREVLKENE